MQHRTKRSIGCLILAMGLFSQSAIHAQVREVTVVFLRAALETLNLNEQLRLTAQYAGQGSLVQADARYMQGDAYSRFSVVEPEGMLVFPYMYVQHDTPAFRTLLNAEPGTTFVFEGYRGRGERREISGMVVTSIRRTPIPLEMEEPEHPDPPTVIGPDAELPPPEPAEEDERTYRLIITDRETGNRTVIVNVKPGATYNVFGSTLVIEAEDQPDQPEQDEVEVEVELQEYDDPDDLQIED